MRVSSLVVASIAVAKVRGFGIRPVTRAGRPSAALAPRMSYLDQLNDPAPVAENVKTPNSFYEQEETAVKGQPVPPPPVAQQPGGAFPPPPPAYYQPIYYNVPPPPPPNAVAPASTSPDSSRDGLQNIVLLGLGIVGVPLWLLMSAVVFPKDAAPPTPGLAPPAASQGNKIEVVLPSSVTSNIGASDAKPAAVIVPSKAITKSEVRNLFNLWNDALLTGDPDAVAKRYSREGVLLPTLSDVPRSDYEGIKDYFVHFLEKKPLGKILEGDIFIGNNWAQDAGIYEFTFQDGSKVKARYSFVYVFEDGQWMISHHHSSLMPEEVVRPKAISETEVRNLFGLWNDALATGDPQKVADRYTKDAVLLPTLSDEARYTNDRIADYFVHFLEKGPTGRIVEGNVKVGPNWAQDAGIYEFTFADGSSVQGRYSFVYAYEGGEWKISNHHSSIMPEAAVDAMKKVASNA